MTQRLRAEELRAACDPATLPFRSTAELEPLGGLIGPERVLDATAFGIGMRPAGDNVLVLGLPATGKTTSMRRLLAAAAAGGRRRRTGEIWACMKSRDEEELRRIVEHVSHHFQDELKLKLSA